VDKIIFLISGNKRSLLLKSIVNKIATLMIKKEQLNEVEKKNKSRPMICSKYVEE
jgi:hypothetical protein